jgi:hypothetical protein
MGYAVLNREQLAAMCSVWAVIGRRWGQRRQMRVDQYDQNRTAIIATTTA